MIQNKFERYMIFQNIRSKKNMKQTTDLSMQTVFPHGTELQGLGSDVSLPACLVVGDFMVVLVLKGGALWNLCSKPKLIKSRTQTKKNKHISPAGFSKSAWTTKNLRHVGKSTALIERIWPVARLGEKSQHVIGGP